MVSLGVAPKMISAGMQPARKTTPITSSTRRSFCNSHSNRWLQPVKVDSVSICRCVSSSRDGSADDPPSKDPVRSGRTAAARRSEASGHVDLGAKAASSGELHTAYDTHLGAAGAAATTPASSQKGDARGAIWVNMEGVTLTSDELASLQVAAKALLGDELAGMDSLPFDLGHPSWSDCLADILRSGAAKGETDLVLLEGAMLLAEQLCLLHRQQRQKRNTDNINEQPATELSAPPNASPAAPASVGIWRPVFASAGGFPRLLYIPVNEYFDMRSSSGSVMAYNNGSDDGERGGSAEGKINVITELGPFTTHFLGTCKWEGPERFVYRISSVRVDWGRQRTLFTLPFKLENALTFFHTLDMHSNQQAPPAVVVGCARSMLGGTMLLVMDTEAAAVYRPM